METARDKNTNEIIDAEQLWILEAVDPLGYICRGCNAIVSPCSYRKENKKRPYFSAKNGHKIDCDIDGNEELIKRAKKERVSTLDGFPAKFPDKLVLKETRMIIVTNSTNNKSSNQKQKPCSNADIIILPKSNRWTAQTIRPICRTFLNYPYDRDLPLHISDVNADTYQYVFK